jgi:hypothetical protein
MLELQRPIVQGMMGGELEDKFSFYIAAKLRSRGRRPRRRRASTPGLPRHNVPRGYTSLPGRSARESAARDHPSTSLTPDFGRHWANRTTLWTFLLITWNKIFIGKLVMFMKNLEPEVFLVLKKMIELNPESGVWVRGSVLQKINSSSSSSSENQTWFQSSSELEQADNKLKFFHWF